MPRVAAVLGGAPGTVFVPGASPLRCPFALPGAIAPLEFETWAIAAPDKPSEMAKVITERDFMTSSDSDESSMPLSSICCARKIAKNPPGSHRDQ
jgi:hypothetical protein